MLPFITIRQDVLSHWPSVDFADGAIVALVVSMDPRNPRVKALPSGEILCTTNYIEQMLPLLGFGAERIRKHVQKLVKAGIIDTVQIFDRRSGHRKRYLKPSRLYYAEVRRIERRADLSLPGRKLKPLRAREYGVGNDPLLLESKTTPDHLHDHKRGDVSSRTSAASPPTLMAAGGAARASFSQEHDERYISDEDYQKRLAASSAQIRAEIEEKRAARRRGSAGDSAKAIR